MVPKIFIIYFQDIILTFKWWEENITSPIVDLAYPVSALCMKCVRPVEETLKAPFNSVFGINV